MKSKTALSIAAWICLVLGALSVIGYMIEPSLGTTVAFLISLALVVCGVIALLPVDDKTRYVASIILNVIIIAQIISALFLIFQVPLLGIISLVIFIPPFILLGIYREKKDDGNYNYIKNQAESQPMSELLKQLLKLSKEVEAEESKIKAYATAKQYLEKKEYCLADKMFQTIINYKDSAFQINSFKKELLEEAEMTYNAATEHFKRKEYDLALSMFLRIRKYKDSSFQIVLIERELNKLR